MALLARKQPIDPTQTSEYRSLKAQMEHVEKRVTRRVRRILARAYGDVRTSRARRNLTGRHQHEHLEWDEATHEAARNVSRVLYNTTPFYRGPIRAMVDMVLGEHGIWPVPTNESSSRAVELFRAWGSDPARCDIRRMRTLSQIQGNWLTRTKVDGDIGAIKVNTGQLQLIASHRIGFAAGKIPDAHSQHGVVLDEYGAPREYHVRPWMRSGHSMATAESTPYKPDVFLFGTLDESTEGVRGKPLLYASQGLIQDVGDHLDYVMIAAKLGACIAGVMTSNDPAQLADINEDVRKQEAGSTDIDTRNDEDDLGLSPGQFWSIDSDGDFRQIKLEHPQTQLPEWVRLIMKSVCAGEQFPYEIATKDIQGLSFSAARMAYMTAWDTAAKWRRRMIEDFLIPVYRWQVGRMVEKGLLDPMERAEALRVTWTEPRMRMIDPNKEAAAIGLQLSQGTTTLTRELKKQGIELDDHVREMAAERELLEASGVSLTWSDKTEGEGEPGVPQTSNQGKDNDDKAAEGDDTETADVEERAQEIVDDVVPEGLNGAQITALLEIIRQVAAGELDKEAAITLIEMSFPTLDTEKVREMVELASKTVLPDDTETD